MTAVSALAFPGSRILAGWWKQLAPFQPRKLWVGHLFIHHVEALVTLSRDSCCDDLTRFVLKALALCPFGSVAEADERLHLGRSFLLQLLHRLQAEGLLQLQPDGSWRPTGRGDEAIARGKFATASQERLTF